MANKPLLNPLPADLPENWQINQIVAPTGAEVGLAEQYGYNYLMAQLNAAQQAINNINEAFPGLAGLVDGVLPVSQGGTGNNSGYVRAGRKPDSEIGEFATVEGIENIASAKGAHAEGWYNSAIEQYSHVEGKTNKAKGFASHAEGCFSEASGFAAHSEGGSTASGGNSHAEGDGAKAEGKNSHAEGSQTQAIGENAHAEGSSTEASGGDSHAEGFATLAKGFSSHAEGAGTETAEGALYAHAEGYQAKAEGLASHAEGLGTIASLNSSHACGSFNKDFSGTNTIFVIGNGNKNGSEINRSNAFRVTYDGATYGLSAFNTSGADYAEYFEWQDTNPEAEDRVGFFVTLQGDKICLAQAGDYLLGIVSANPCIIGNADEDWLGRWEHDDFGRFIQIDVETPVTELRHKEVPLLDENGEPTGEVRFETEEVATGEVIHGWDYKQNPDYDSSQQYIERKDRPEWAAVGMLGVLAVRDDGSCQVDGFCQCADSGIATAAEKYIPGQTYRVIARVTENIVKVVFR